MIVRVLLFRDWLRAFYGKYSRYIDPALRALTAFLAFWAARSDTCPCSGTRAWRRCWP